MDVSLFHGELVGHAQGHARRQDRDLVHGVGMFEDVGEHGMAALVVGDPLLLGVGQHHALPALPEQHPVARRFEVLHGDVDTAPPHGVQRRLVDQVGQVGPTHAGSTPGDHAEVDVVGHALALAVHLEDG